MQLSRISEAEQIEMAIALSLEQQASEANEENTATNLGTSSPDVPEAEEESDSVTRQNDEGAAVSGVVSASTTDSNEQREESASESDGGRTAKVNDGNQEPEEAAGVNIPHDSNIEEREVDPVSTPPGEAEIS